jgi:hypothetical protein
MKFNFSLALLALVLTLATVACKKEADEVSAPLDSNTGLKNTGSFIKGTVTTRDSDGNDVEFAFDHTYQDGIMDFYGNPGTTFYSAYLYRDFTGYSGQNGDYSRISFDLDTLDDDTPSNPELRLNAKAELSAGKSFFFESYGDAGNTVITDYTYDAANNTLSGQFEVTATTNTGNSQEATIEGSFLITNYKQHVD